MFDLSKTNTDGLGPMIWAPMSEYNLRYHDLGNNEYESTKLIS